LPSARRLFFTKYLATKVLDKEAVADVQFAKLSLPSVTLGKAFAKYFTGFDKCFRHSTKQLIPVAMLGLFLL
jgi:hypothetical protein